MNRYETITIFDAETIEDDRKAILERIESLVTGQNGTLLDFDNWGSRKLAYPIRKKNQGYYVRVDYCGDGDLVSAIERMLGHDQRVLRFMTIRLAIDVDPEALKSEMAETQEETETAEAVEEAPEAEPEAEEAASETEQAEAPADTESEEE